MGLLDTGGASNTGSAATFTGVLRCSRKCRLCPRCPGHRWRAPLLRVASILVSTRRRRGVDRRKLFRLQGDGDRRLGSSQRLLVAVEHHRRLRLGRVALRRAQQLHHSQLCRARRRDGVDIGRHLAHRRFTECSGQRRNGDRGAWRRSWFRERIVDHGYRFGYLFAGAAGVLWGSYFVPAQWAKVSAQLGNFPLALGILAAGTVLVATAGGPAKLSPRVAATQISAGVLFGIGNLALLGLVARVGTGVGFTIAQLSLLVNASVGIFVFKVPKPGSKAARVVIVGISLAAMGGILIGSLR